MMKLLQKLSVTSLPRWQNNNHAVCIELVNAGFEGPNKGKAPAEACLALNGFNTSESLSLGNKLLLPGKKTLIWVKSNYSKKRQ